MFKIKQFVNKEIKDCEVVSVLVQYKKVDQTQIRFDKRVMEETEVLS